MALKNTNLYIQMAALPATFKGTPQDLATTMVQRMKIVSPNGTNFIFIGSSEPTSNVGPWLKNGTQWYVWNNAINRYVPQDISASETRWYTIGASTPTVTVPGVWLRTTADATDINPSHGLPIGWYIFDGVSWVPFNSIVFSGPTGSRPATPEPYQQYYDTTIGTLIWWERSAWRTVSGVPGDVKFVIYTLLSDALNANPGWRVLGDSVTAWRGRYLSQATTDGITTLAIPAGITARTAHETFGEDKGYANTGGPPQIPGGFALWALVKD